MTDENSEILREANLKLQKLVANSEKLLRDISGLRGDVNRLTERFLHINDRNYVWHKERKDDLIFQYRRSPPKTSINEALSDIQSARESIMNCEHDIRLINSAIETILRNNVSREDMKPYLKN